MLYVSKDSGSYFIKTSRGFDDVEFPADGLDHEVLLKFFEDYNEVQVYLANVYALGRQRAYGAIDALEVPKCLRTIAEVPVAASDGSKPKKRATAVRSSGTSRSQRKQQESSTNTKA